MTDLLRLDGVVAGWAEPVVGPLSLRVARGEVIGLAGPNGAGKSTVLGAVIGTARTFAGRIEREPGARVSVLRQQPARLPEMPLTGLELLRVARAASGWMPNAVAPLLDVRLDRLSGGQYQLLNVWASLGSGADLVLMDEPTNNMDPKTVRALAELLLASRPARGVLLVSHEHDFLDAVCDRIVEVAP